MESWDSNEEFESDIKVKKKVKIPKDYYVYLLNDNVTLASFVVDIIVDIFKKSEVEAIKITQSIHQNGSGLVGIYSKDIAYSKAEKVHKRASEAGFPLQCVVKEE